MWKHHSIWSALDAGRLWRRNFVVRPPSEHGGDACFGFILNSLRGALITAYSSEAPAAKPNPSSTEATRIMPADLVCVVQKFIQMSDSFL